MREQINVQQTPGRRGSRVVISSVDHGRGTTGRVRDSPGYKEGLPALE